MCKVLEVCLNGANKTKIVYEANLNFSRLNRYLNILLKMGFVDSSVGVKKSNVVVVYNATRAGLDFLYRYRALKPRNYIFAIKNLE